MNCHDSSTLAAALRIVCGAASPRDHERVAALLPARERDQVMALARELASPDPDVARNRHVAETFSCMTCAVHV